MQPFERKALVTGATGFIGAHLVRRLIADGWQVAVIARPSSKLDLSLTELSSLQLYQHDGSTEQMIGIMQDVRPAVVFHLASMFLAQHESRDVEPLISSNLLFSTQLAEAMVKTKVNLLVNTGTSWQHYENQEYNPVCLYAATKQAFEVILKYYTETTPLKVVTLKLFDTYGPNDPRPKLFALLKKVATSGEALSMSPGEQLIDLVYIDDVVQAFIVAAEALLNGGIDQMEDFAVSSGNPISLQELVEVYSHVVNRPMNINWGGRPYRNREVMFPWDKGNRLPGWRPSIELAEGIRLIEGSTSR